LHGNWKLAVGPSCLSISTINWGVRCFLPLGCRLLSSCCGSPIVYHLLSKIRSVFFPLFDKFLLASISDIFWWKIIHFALNTCDSRFGISIILGIDLLSGLFEDPIVLIVVIVASLVHEILEYLSHVVVIRPLLKLQVPAIIEVSMELLWHSPCQRLNRGLDLLVLNPIVLVILILSLKALPRKCALKDVNQDESNRLKVVSSALFYA
jgi:hypothetical protein